jgi:hypothetical protein
MAFGQFVLLRSFFSLFSPFLLGVTSMAGYTAAKALGYETWHEALQKEILDKLGMSFTTTDVDKAVATDNYARQWAADGSNNYEKVALDPDIDRLIDSSCPAGCIISNAKDMTKWLRFQLNYGADLGLSVEQTQFMWHPRISPFLFFFVVLLDFLFFILPAQPNNPGWLPKPTQTETFMRGGYGMSWEELAYLGFQGYRHGGQTSGFTSNVIFFPTLNIGLFTSLTGAVPGMKKVFFYQFMAWYVLDQLLAPNPWVTQELVCGVPNLSPGYPCNLDPGSQLCNQTQFPPVPPLKPTVPLTDLKIPLEHLRGTYFSGVFPWKFIIKTYNNDEKRLGWELDTKGPYEKAHGELELIEKPDQINGEYKFRTKMDSFHSQLLLQTPAALDNLPLVVKVEGGRVAWGALVWLEPDVGTGEANRWSRIWNDLGEVVPDDKNGVPLAVWIAVGVAVFAAIFSIFIVQRRKRAAREAEHYAAVLSG